MEKVSHVKMFFEVIIVVNISLLQKYLFSYSIPLHIDRSVFVAHFTDNLPFYRVLMSSRLRPECRRHDTFANYRVFAFRSDTKISTRRLDNFTKKDLVSSPIQILSFCLKCIMP
jgi:hypothetical protein